LNVFLAGGFDGLQTGIALLAAQSFQLFDGRGLADVLAKDGDVDVFGEAFDQAVAFGERGATLKSRRGPPASSSLKSASSVQQTQKSFSIFCSLVRSRSAAPTKRSRRYSSLAASKV
jgi:hypothetical protein